MKRVLIIVFVIVAALVAGVVGAWYSGAVATDLSWQGWLALVLGVIGTAALGGGLMSLVFLSSREGYDDDSSKPQILHDSFEPPAP